MGSHFAGFVSSGVWTGRATTRGMSREKFKNENEDWAPIHTVDHNDDGSSSFNLDQKRKRRADKAELGANSWQAAAAKRNDKDSAKRQKYTDDGEVFVSNLPFEATEQSVEEVFAACGSILKVKILTWVTGKLSGKCNGRAFVKFDSKDSVPKAMEMNGHDMGGRPLEVVSNPHPSGEAPRPPPSHEEKIKVGAESAVAAGLEAAAELNARTKKEAKKAAKEAKLAAAAAEAEDPADDEADEGDLLD